MQSLTVLHVIVSPFTACRAWIYSIPQTFPHVLCSSFYMNFPFFVIRFFVCYSCVGFFFFSIIEFLLGNDGRRLDNFQMRISSNRIRGLDLMTQWSPIKSQRQYIQWILNAYSMPVKLYVQICQWLLPHPTCTDEWEMTLVPVKFQMIMLKWSVSIASCVIFFVCLAPNQLFLDWCEAAKYTVSSSGGCRCWEIQRQLSFSGSSRWNSASLCEKLLVPVHSHFTLSMQLQPF